MENQENYQKEYSEFLILKKSGAIDDKTVGKLIVDFAQHFSDYNLYLANSQINYDKLYCKNIQSTDPESGKPMSAAKAEAITRGSDEGAKLTVSKSHLQNIEQMINALKSLQRALGNEYSHSSLS